MRLLEYILFIHYQIIQSILIVAHPLPFGQHFLHRSRQIYEEQVLTDRDIYKFLDNANRAGIQGPQFIACILKESRKFGRS